MTIGYKQVGHGSESVIVLHDWFSDCTSYDSCLPYLNLDKFTFAFMDVRGYGRSKNMPGQFTLDEVTADVLDLADQLTWKKFHLVGHSMNGMVVQRVALKAPDRVKSIVAITPVPASGGKIPQDMMPMLEDAAVHNDEGAKGIVNMMSGNRQQDSFINFKVQKWRETSIPEARVAYLHMFSDNDFADEINGLDIPCLVLTGQYDAEGHQLPAMEETFGKWLPKCEFTEIENTGHYPMQETPVYFAGLMEGFLAKNS